MSSFLLFIRYYIYNAIQSVRKANTLLSIQMAVLWNVSLVKSVMMVGDCIPLVAVAFKIHLTLSARTALQENSQMS